MWMGCQNYAHTLTWVRRMLHFTCNGYIWIALCQRQENSALVAEETQSQFLLVHHDSLESFSPQFEESFGSQGEERNFLVPLFDDVGKAERSSCVDFSCALVIIVVTLGGHDSSKE